MASGKGHNGGFNPFRDSHGRFSGTDAGHIAALQPRKGVGTMNNALRTASGRTVAPAVAAHVTPALLAKIDAQPLADDTPLSPGSNGQLNDIMGANDWRDTMYASYDGLNGAAFSMLSEGRGQMPEEHVQTLITAYKEAGFDPPAGATNTELLHYMDSFNGVEFGSQAEANRTSYGIAYALKAGNQNVALTLADGRAGAGIGWDLQRQELGADLSAEPDY